jgi:hypothetical protein
MRPGTLKDDLLSSAAAIADYTGFSLRRVFHLLERGLLPGRKLGGTWISSKRALDQYFDLNAPRKGQPPVTNSGSEGHALRSPSFCVPASTPEENEESRK